MTPKEILLAAAALLQQDKVSLDAGGYGMYGYACVALEVAAGDSTNEHALEKAMNMFSDLYKPSGKGVHDCWFGHYRVPGAIDERIAALLDTASRLN